MDIRRWLSLRDCVVWVIVIGGHVLLLVLFSSGGARVRPLESDADDRSSLLLLTLTQLVEVPPIEKEAPQHSAAIRAREAPTFDTAITARTETPPTSSAIDWYGEVEEVARAAVEEGAQPGPRTFGEHPTSAYRKCKKRESSFEWDPEPKKAGIAGGLPYVRLGDRCILGLGFFGCAIGKLPGANGHLFDDMHDPNQPTSSRPPISSEICGSTGSGGPMSVGDAE